MSTLSTAGVHHVGLTVRNLARTERFFVDVLGFTAIGGRPEKRVRFVRDENVLVSLWEPKDPAAARAFDREAQLGLHHLALAVPDSETLDAFHERLTAESGVRIEFAPEPLSGGPARHMIFREPGGLRLELIWKPA